jgi:hypothetical protein
MAPIPAAVTSVTGATATAAVLASTFTPLVTVTLLLQPQQSPPENLVVSAASSVLASAQRSSTSRWQQRLGRQLEIRWSAASAAADMVADAVAALALQAAAASPAAVRCEGQQELCTL